MEEKDNREEFLQVANSRKGRYKHDHDVKHHDHSYDGDDHDHDNIMIEIMIMMIFWYLTSSQVRKLERDLQTAQRNMEVTIFQTNLPSKYFQLFIWSFIWSFILLLSDPYLILKVFNELLSELTPGEEHPEDRRLLHDVSGTCREMQVFNSVLLMMMVVVVMM